MKILQLLVIETFVIFTHTFGSPSIDWCRGTRIEDDLYADVLRGIYPSNLNETFILRPINNYTSFFPCVSECCRNDKCNVAFMYSHKCFLFSCPSFKNSPCQPLKKKDGTDEEDEDIDTYWITVRFENDFELELAELANKFENITATYDNNNQLATKIISFSSTPTSATTTEYLKITPTTTSSNVNSTTTTANIVNPTTTTPNIVNPTTTTTPNIVNPTTTSIVNPTTTSSHLNTSTLTNKTTIVRNQTNNNTNKNKKIFNGNNNKIINKNNNKIINNKNNTSKNNNTICGSSFVSNPFKLLPNCDWKIVNVVFCLVIIIVLLLLSVCCIVGQCLRYCNKDERQYRAMYNNRKNSRSRPVYYGFYSDDENEEDDDDEDELLVRRHLIEMVNSKKVMSSDNGVDESGDDLDGGNVRMERVGGMGSLNGRKMKGGVGLSGSLGSRKFDSKNRKSFRKK